MSSQTQRIIKPTERLEALRRNAKKLYPEEGDTTLIGVVVLMQPLKLCPSPAKNHSLTKVI